MCTVHMTKHTLSHLKASRGQIVVISSMAGEFGAQLRSAYCASKFALTGFFESLRFEYSDALSVTICCPPAVKTDFRKHALNYYDNDSYEQARKEFPHLFNKPGQNEKKKMELKDCVDDIMSAVDKRAHKVFFPLKMYFFNYIRPIVPQIMDPLLKRQSKL
eukprot:GHVR01172759.1.p1 GENE.GHVR01172759.1~~GHVR01172759.1.p1  ORF type:complete len:161 (+),score=24.28 GHVR01172759.1:488-970(+)